MCDLVSERRQLLQENGMLDAAELLELQRDQAYADRAKELIDLLIRGCATKADERQFCEMMAVKVAEMDEAARADRAQLAVLRGLAAFHELGADGEPVTVN